MFSFTWWTMARGTRDIFSKLRFIWCRTAEPEVRLSETKWKVASRCRSPGERKLLTAYRTLEIFLKRHQKNKYFIHFLNKTILIWCRSSFNFCILTASNICFVRKMKYLIFFLLLRQYSGPKESFYFCCCKLWAQESIVLKMRKNIVFSFLTLFTHSKDFYFLHHIC